MDDETLLVEDDDLGDYELGDTAPTYEVRVEGFLDLEDKEAITSKVIGSFATRDQAVEAAKDTYDTPEEIVKELLVTEPKQKFFKVIAEAYYETATEFDAWLVYRRIVEI